MRFGYDGDGQRLWKREYLPRPLGVVVRLTLYAGYGFEEGYVEEVQPHEAGAGEPPSDVCGKVVGVTDLGFTGQRQEISFGLYDYNARYLSPALGRFISPDSIVPNFANPQSLNRYAYTLNNPLKYTDPSGHFPWLVPILIGIALIPSDVQPVQRGVCPYHDCGSLDRYNTTVNYMHDEMVQNAQSSTVGYIQSVDGVTKIETPTFVRFRQILGFVPLSNRLANYIINLTFF